MPRRLISIFDLVLTLATWTIFALGLALILSRDTATATDMQSRSQDYVRAVEFDFLDWTFSAAGVKLSQASARTQAYLPEADQVRLVEDWFNSPNAPATPIALLPMSDETPPIPPLRR